MRISLSNRSSSSPTIRIQLSKQWSMTLYASTIVLGSFTLLLILAYQHYRSIGYRDPTSLFFDDTRAYERSYSQQRMSVAETFIEGIKGKPDSAITKHIGTPTLCIGVATVARRHQQYVNLTIGSLLTGLEHETRWPVFLNLLVAHTDPSKHPDWRSEWLHKLPDRLLQYNEKDVATIREWESGGWYRNKTIYDYTLLLKDCYDTGAQYILMVEDDVIAAEGWYDHMMNALKQVDQKMQERPAANWVYLRLFYVDDLLGWNSEQWPQYLFWSFVTWALTTSGLLLIRARSSSYRYLCTDRTTLILSTAFIPAAILLFFMAGRHTTWPLSPGVHEMNKYGCCSQSLVFPRHIIPDLLARTDLTTDWLVDMMLEQIADRAGWLRWAVIPALFQHIGATSSKGYGFDDSAKTLWNFRFEQHYTT